MRSFAQLQLFGWFKEHRKLIAIAIGIAVAATPLVAFDFWLNDVVERQGQEEVNAYSKRAVAIADNRIGQAVTTLDDLAKRGIEACGPASIEQIRESAFVTPPIKEIAIVSPGGQVQCTDTGMLQGQRQIVFSEPLSGAPGYAIELVEVSVPRNEQFVRLRRASGAGEIAALVPLEHLFPLVSTHGGPVTAHIALHTAAGTRLGEVGNPQAFADGQQFFLADVQSERFGFNAKLAVPRARMQASRSDLNKLSLFVPAAIAILIMALAALIPRQQAGNPIADLRRAIQAGEFVPYYQPIVDIRSGQLQGAEVLARWKKPDGSIVLPGTFIALAESSGLILELTRALMRKACAEAGPAVALRPALKLGFNFSAQLFNDSIVKEVRNIFSGSPIAMSQVVLEVTERDPIENLSETRQVIAALQALGLRIAIDDVGTGHSGLSYMLKLGVDIIKIDKMFVDAIGTDRNSTTIVETLIDLAHNMRMDIVAEGVENFEQVVHLRELGIRSAQGYVFAPPLPGSAFLQLVEAIDPVRAGEPIERKVAGAARRYMSARKKFASA